MRDILHEIIAHKRVEIEIAKSLRPLFQLMEELEHYNRIPLSMAQALRTTKGGVIAEFKRRSPSKGWIKREANVVEITKGYVAQGAAALSILTDRNYFGGSLNDLVAVRKHVAHTPLLRKEFIVDEYQLYEARLAGADAVLLIAAALTPEECEHLANRAHQLGLEVLLELHAKEELLYITDHVDMVGINNRNLGSFVTDVNISFELIELLPKGSLLVSESGIDAPQVVKRLQQAGFSGFLIGEHFMRTENPPVALGQFIHQLT